MCLWCAVPIRGAAYGNECLRLVLGDVEPGEPEEHRPRASMRVLVGFAIALAATALPWTTFGEGASPFGAWSLSPRWAMLAAVASALGVAAWLVRRRRPGADRAWDIVELALAVAVVLGSVLEWFRPPFPSRPSVVPWIAAGAGLYAAASALRGLIEDSRAVR